MANVSGLYSRSDNNDPVFTRETLRLDVDGDFPQMAASGAGLNGLQVRTHWVATPLVKNTTPAGDEWTGPIVFKSGVSSFLPHDTVTLTVQNGQLRATFRRVGVADRVVQFAFASPRFHEITIEYDAEEGVDRVLDYETHSHPDHPATLANEVLSIDTVFERAGFRVLRTGEDGVVASSSAGDGGEWSNSEMHDAMQVHFSQLASLPASQRNRARWALWTFFAGAHEDGPDLGGIMFDSVGATQRQGTALFLNSFISNAPDNDPAADAWRRRMAFWTAVHEMGHGFNLLHAWQKHLGTPWRPQPTGTSLLTFMNYPYFYESGPNQDANTTRFFQDFGFRFTDDELMFLRHAPEEFVIMGGEQFGENHAFEQANQAQSPTFSLEVRVNRQGGAFEFLEPVVLELKLKNTSRQPVLPPARSLRMLEQMTIRIQKRGGEAKVFHPFAHKCYQPELQILQPGDSIY